jgi:sec-independent protein translocase protein TatB
MFGLGMGEIVIILVVALLFLGPTKLPDAAKQIGKAIRELRKQTQNLQETIEQDEHIGGTVRELKSALRGDEIFTPIKPKVTPPDGEKPVPQGAIAGQPESGTPAAPPLPPGGLPVPSAAAAAPAEPVVVASAAAVDKLAPAAPVTPSTTSSSSSPSPSPSPSPSHHG